MSQANTEASTSNSSNSPDELLSSLQKQIEFYFSRKNLSNDHFLVSKMDKNQFVPLETITNFQMIINLTEDVEMIKKAIKNSDKVVLSTDESKVKPNFTIERRKVIIRDTPEATTESDIKNLFSNSDKTPLEIKEEISNHWILSFNSEKEALGCLDFLRDKTLQDEYIKARLKNESLLKSFGQSAESKEPVSNSDMYHNNQNNHHQSYHMQQNMYMQNNMMQNQYWNTQIPNYYQPYDQMNYQNGMNKYYKKPYYKKYNNYNNNYNTYNNTTNNTNVNNNTNNKHYDNQRRNVDKNNYQKGNRKTYQNNNVNANDKQKKFKKQNNYHQRRENYSNYKKTPSVDLSTKSFPPLPSKFGTEEDIFGYDNFFMRYDRKAIVKVFERERKSETGVVLPEGIHMSKVILQTPHKDLEIYKPVPQKNEVKPSLTPEKKEQTKLSTQQQTKTAASVVAKSLKQPSPNTKLAKQVPVVIIAKSTSPTKSSTKEEPKLPSKVESKVGEPKSPKPANPLIKSSEPLVPQRTDSPMKSFAEVVISAKDIHIPEEVQAPIINPGRRNSGRGNTLMNGVLPNEGRGSRSNSFNKELKHTKKQPTQRFEKKYPKPHANVESTKDEPRDKKTFAKDKRKPQGKNRKREHEAHSTENKENLVNKQIVEKEEAPITKTLREKKETDSQPKSSFSYADVVGKKQ